MVTHQVRRDGVRQLWEIYIILFIWLKLPRGEIPVCLRSARQFCANVQHLTLAVERPTW